MHIPNPLSSLLLPRQLVLRCANEILSRDGLAEHDVLLRLVGSGIDWRIPDLP